MRVAGPACTVRCTPGDNLALHRAIAVAAPGEVIVADYGGSIDSGPFGEIMALACRMRGVAGFVINGAVRDSAEIVEMGFPVFARGLNIRGTVKSDPGALDIVLEIGEARIAPGDYVIADNDAVIIVPADRAHDALEAGRARAEGEARMMDRLRAGETTLQILGLEGEIST
ncbi:RraA family protein [Ponticoccus sp. SC2-23]|nr:RraA family protein [Ponticoccus sp. SC6-9]MBM1224226.1 RraA family protein [Ponticoccus sp. SC6-15]MBM1229995.1 RraA family protein [Ponticoccus sp. SC6-38]MBM1233192.1 RraA family protein [Ponticoccus sp. SC6-45]MBM1236858.1 RraA family protein [Ponticoccus sp. SC6-49]MBM1242203.1 RraA family protein [Ponticoccus sp. SC2-64]MBM1246716.1 RraA family protein [Ponticoccus sp. SC6-42]MBM1251194.1 RraA family protein [Ponticoccus sp. SC6-33]MBM1254867.1 RraA family protein [Ponticoccus sp. 